MTREMCELYKIGQYLSQKFNIPSTTTPRARYNPTEEFRLLSPEIGIII